MPRAAVSSVEASAFIASATSLSLQRRDGGGPVHPDARLQQRQRLTLLAPSAPRSSAPASANRVRAGAGRRRAGALRHCRGRRRSAGRRFPSAAWCRSRWGRSSGRAPDTRAWPCASRTKRRSCRELRTNRRGGQRAAPARHLPGRRASPRDDKARSRTAKFVTIRRQRPHLILGAAISHAPSWGMRLAVYEVQPGRGRVARAPAGTAVRRVVQTPRAAMTPGRWGPPREGHHGCRALSG